MEHGVRSYAWQALEIFDTYGDREAIVSGGVRQTYTDLRDTVLSLATAVHGAGLRAGQAVALLLNNPPEAVPLQLALHLLGCRTAWIAPNTPERYRLDFVRMARVDAVIYDTRVQADLGQHIAEANRELPVFCLGPGGLGPDLTAAPPAAHPPVAPPDIEPETLFQTGGTTGRPKLVHHRHRFFETVLRLSREYTARGEHRLKHAAWTGFWHVSGQVPALMTLFTGGTLYLHEIMDYSLLLRQIETERITSMLFTPPLLSILLDHPKLPATDVSSVRMLSCSGGPTAPARMAQAVERFGSAVRPTYGMSEAAFITALPDLANDPERTGRLASCGYPYGDIKIEIRDRHGDLQGVGEVGEVWITGGLVMAGYWGQPELTAETLVDGWLRTGDLGYLDKDGYLFLVDRDKDMIITGYGSTNVYCRPVEDVLAGHPDVLAAAVVGVPDERFGEVAHAFVVARPGAEVGGDELRGLVATELSEKWAPTGVEFVDALPLTGVGKVDKKALRTRYLQRASA